LRMKASEDDVTRQTSRLARLTSKAERLLSKMDERADQIEEKVGGKLAKRAESMVKDKKFWIVATIVAFAAIPAASSALAVIYWSVQMVILMFKMALVCMAPAGMLLSSGAAFFQPAIVTSLSTAASLATVGTALVLFLLPRARSLLLLALGSLLPLLNIWLAAIPARSVVFVDSIRMFDPIRPFLEEPFFRPLLNDLFLTDFIDIIPKPFLVPGPVDLVVESSVPSPFFALKIALSLAALSIAGWAWYRERDNVRRLLTPGGTTPLAANSHPPLLPAKGQEVDSEELEERGRRAALEEWEQQYKMRPPPSADPSQWTVDDLSVELSRAGLQECVEPLRRARIDGRVALTLTWDDEDEVRRELGISKLGERRRLMLFLEDLRDMSKRQ